MHFTVGVITEDIMGYHNALEPYDENGSSEYMEFIETEKEGLEDYQTRGAKKIKTEDGRYLNRGDKEFKVIMPTSIPFSEIGFDASLLKKGETLKTVIPNDVEEVEVLFTTLYSSFEEYMEKELFFYKRDDVQGVYGYWSNTSSKYDWYQLGGRWRGLLLVKEDVEHILGGPGVFEDKLEERYVPKGYKWVDSARIKDIEWDMMKEISKEKALKLWEKAKKMKREYWGKSEIYMKTGVVFKYTKKHYLERMMNFSTYAVLSEHGWFEKEDFTDNSNKWNKEYFDKFIKEANENHFFSIVDYHV